MIGSERVAHPSGRSRKTCSSGRQGCQGEPPEDPLDGGERSEGGSLVDRVAEEYLDRLLDGERPDRAEIVRRHPEIAGELRRRLALMDILFRARPGG